MKKKPQVANIISSSSSIDGSRNRTYFVTRISRIRSPFQVRSRYEYLVNGYRSVEEKRANRQGEVINEAEQYAYALFCTAVPKKYKKVEKRTLQPPQKIRARARRNLQPRHPKLTDQETELIALYRLYVPLFELKQSINGQAFIVLIKDEFNSKFRTSYNTSNIKGKLAKVCRKILRE